MSIMPGDGQIPLPERLADPASLPASSPAGAARRAFLARLPGLLARSQERWGLDVGAPYSPGGITAWVAPVRDRTGRDLALKLSWRHDEGRDEAAGLAVWRGDGIVRLHDSAIEGEDVALLLERCRPGDPLAARVPESEHDAVIARILARLWVTPSAPDRGRFRPLSAMCASWATAARARLPTAALPDPAMINAGIELFAALPGDASGPAVLLATDLHAGNVLSAEREPWLAIDPKPYLGDPAYDVLQHMLNCRRLFADPVTLASGMAARCDLDAARVRRWLFARCAVDAVQWPELAGVAARLGAAV